jgi:hypothetical protein
MRSSPPADCRVGLRDLPGRVQRQEGKAARRWKPTQTCCSSWWRRSAHSAHVCRRSIPNLKTTEGRPRKYYFSEKSDSAEVAAVESGVAAPVGKEDAKLGEHGLYPLLSSYLWAEFGVYSKRIDEKRSSNKRGPNGNRWLYPDLVGMEDLGPTGTKRSRTASISIRTSAPSCGHSR